MTISQIDPATYAPSNRMLIAVALRDFEAIRDSWQDEAAAAALTGNPVKARYIESWIARL